MRSRAILAIFLGIQACNRGPSAHEIALQSLVAAQQRQIAGLKAALAAREMPIDRPAALIVISRSDALMRDDLLQWTPVPDGQQTGEYARTVHDLFVAAGYRPGREDGRPVDPRLRNHPLVRISPFGYPEMRTEHRKVFQITGIAPDGDNAADAEFVWGLEPTELGAFLKGGIFDEHWSARWRGHARLRRFDDGWRAIEITGVDIRDRERLPSNEPAPNSR